MPDDRRIDEVDCPEWGGTMRVRSLDPSDLRELAEFVGTNRKFAAFLAASLVDEDGEPLFSIEEVEKLEQRSAIPMRRLIMVACRLSGIGPLLQ